VGGLGWEDKVEVKVENWNAQIKSGLSYRRWGSYLDTSGLHLATLIKYSLRNLASHHPNSPDTLFLTLTRFKETVRPWLFAVL